MPMELASIAQAAKPSSTMRRNAACSSTGSGVVRPVAWIVQSCVESPAATGSGSGGTPMPSVPTTPARRPSRFSACAVHHAVEVLPLVPVAASTSSVWLGSSKNARGDLAGGGLHRLQRGDARVLEAERVDAVLLHQAGGRARRERARRRSARPSLA